MLIGYRPGRKSGLRLLLATLQAGVLRYAAQVRAGGTASQRAALARRLADRPRRRSIVPCPVPAWWVEPEFYCRVAFQAWTPHGQLRQAVFAGWLDEPP